MGGQPNLPCSRRRRTPCKTPLELPPRLTAGVSKIPEDSWGLAALKIGRRGGRLLRQSSKQLGSITIAYTFNAE